MKKITNILYYVAMGIMLLWFAYNKGWIFANFDSVTPQEAVTMLESDTNVTLLDVRTPEEFRSGHLRGATLIPLSKLEANLGKIAPYKQTKLLVYCRSGNRSVAASRILAKHGFHPLNIKEGIMGLKAAGAALVH